MDSVLIDSGWDLFLLFAISWVATFLLAFVVMATTHFFFGPWLRRLLFRTTIQVALS